MAVVALLMVPDGCSRKKDQPRIAETGPETWMVDGAPYRIDSTHYEHGPSNVVTYVMRYPIPPGTPTAGLNPDTAGMLVWPLVKYAYNNRTFERARIPPLEGSKLPTVNLAVDVLPSPGGRPLFRYEVPAGK
jgi:hypothetical protein